MLFLFQIQYISLIGLMQVVTGCLMVVFGVLSMLHDASLSSVGAGLWSGAMAMGNGVVGLMASLNGCLSPDRTLSPLSVTIYLALCLVSVGVSNLAIILTAIGLLKDSQKPFYIIPKDKVSTKNARTLNNYYILVDIFQNNQHTFFLACI